MEILGIDIGGSGIKGAIVDTQTGELLSERERIPTPKPATPKKVGKTVAKLARHFDWEGPIGCGFPAVIQHGIALTAANVSKNWIGANVRETFQEASGNVVRIINDADAAGLAEASFGGGKGNDGVIMVITVGTGIGSALVYRGIVVPNTELGHVLFKKDQTIEKYAADIVRKNKDLSWDDWGKRFNKVLNYLHRLFYPDLYIIGGGASKKFDKFIHMLDVDADIQPAQLLNNAGIVGAALACEQKLNLEGKTTPWKREA